MVRRLLRRDGQSQRRCRNGWPANRYCRRALDTKSAGIGNDLGRDGCRLPGI